MHTAHHSGSTAHVPWLGNRPNRSAWEVIGTQLIIHSISTAQVP